MPTLSAGKTDSGVTLVELVVVVALISVIVGISFPAISSGVDSLRLNAATNSVVSFFNTGLSRAERRQQVVEITISKPENTLSMRSTDPRVLAPARNAGRRFDHSCPARIASKSGRAAQLLPVSGRHCAAFWRGAG